MKLASGIGRLLADGIDCTPRQLLVEVTTSQFATFWPLALPGEASNACTKGPVTRLRFEFLSEEGRFAAEFDWTGSDVTYDLEVPLPTQSITPTPTAAFLPRSGGDPGRRDASAPVVAALGTFLTVASLGLFGTMRRT